MIIDGKKIAEEIIASLMADRASLPATVKIGIIMSEGDPASASFVRIKERVAERLRVEIVREMIGPETSEDLVVHGVQRLAGSTMGVIVQLPLPVGLSVDKILSAIPPHCDLDGINPIVTDAGRLVQPPVVEALDEILKRANVSLRDKRVVGAGRLVGKPAFAYFKKLGADVTLVTETEGSLADLHDADVVVLGTGRAGMVTPDLLKKGVVLIDAGTSEQGGKIQGDADPSCADVASVFTPVPGGVGPLAVAMIFKNLFTLAKLK